MLNLGSILESYYCKNYERSLRCQSKPTSVKCKLDEIEKKVTKHVHNLYLEDATVCDQKTEVIRHAVTTKVQSNIGKTALESTIAQKECTAQETAKAVSKSKSTTVNVNVEPTLRVDSPAGAAASASVASGGIAHTREVSRTNTETQSHATEQHLGASGQLASQQAAKSTSGSLTLEHSCTVKNIHVPTDTLRSCKEKLNFMVVYTVAGSTEKFPIPKKDKLMKQFLKGIADKTIKIDGTYTWKLTTWKDTRE